MKKKGHLQIMLTSFKHFFNTYGYLYLSFLLSKNYFYNSSTESMQWILFLTDLPRLKQVLALGLLSKGLFYIRAMPLMEFPSRSEIKTEL